MADPARLRWLEDQLASWEAEGLISGGQAQAIRDRYRTVPDMPLGPGAPGPSDAAQHGRLVSTLAVLGAILVGVGVILFLAANWERIPKAVRVGAILVAMIASYTAGFELTARRNYPRAGQGLILLGVLLFGSGIWLIAQIFHLESHYPNGLLFWAGGAVLTGFAAGSTPVAILAALLLGAWTISEQTDFGRPNYLYPALVLLLGLPLAHRLRSPVAAATHLVGLAAWALVDVHLWAPRAMAFGPSVLGLGLLAFGCAYLGVALWRGAATRSTLAGPRGGVPWPLTGGTLSLLGGYLLTFARRAHDNWVGRQADPDWSALRGSTPALALLAVVAAVAVAALAGAHVRYWRARAAGEPCDRLAPWLAGAVALLLVSGAALLLPGVEVHRPLIFNLILFFAILGTVVAGYQARSAGWINLGLLFFAIDVVTRYFDLFWSLLDRSVFFIGAGLLLLVAGGLLERGRRRLLANLGATGVDRP